MSTSIKEQIKNTIAILKDHICRRIDVVDNLTSTSNDLPLSANMGKTLNEKINVINTCYVYGFNDVVNKATSNQNYDYSTIIVIGKIAFMQIALNIGRSSIIEAWNNIEIGIVNSNFLPKYHCTSVVSSQNDGKCADITINTNGVIAINTRNYTLQGDDFIRGQLVYILNK